MELGGVAYETVCRRLCSDIGCRRSAISRHIYLRWPTDATRTSWAVSAKRERASVFSLGEGNSHSLCDCPRLLKCVCAIIIVTIAHIAATFAVVRTW